MSKTNSLILPEIGIGRSQTIKNLAKAAKRIKTAIKNKEKIILYGDADLDGVASVIILLDSIKNLGGRVSAICFPDRENDGYGITKKALKFLKPNAPALLVAVDCGISNFEEIKIANKMGFKVVLVEHHEILEKLPEAEIIVDPKQPNDKYPFKSLAAAGIAFKLAELILEKKMTEGLRKNLLELAALATLADMMPQTDDNKLIIDEGLGYVESSWRPGIQALFNLEEIKELDFIQKIYKINSLLNVRDIENGQPAAFRILISKDKKEAEKLAKRLYKKRTQSRKRISKIMEEIEKSIFKKEKDPVVFEGSRVWDGALLGIIASSIVQKYNKPVFLYKKIKNESQGGVRSSAGFNAVEAMKSCSKYLITYGGHPQAAGFRIKNKDLKQFKNCLIEYCNRQIKE